MAEITTTRINRQFRSLRSKCAALASHTLTPPKHTISVTYGHSSHHNLRRLPEDNETPPLAIFQSLDKVGARLHLDRAIIENMQLSKRIYEVRDTFKNIVQCSGTNSREETNVSRRLLPLTAICARLVGEHIQSEIEASLADASAPEGREDGLCSQAMDELYESIPAPYRHYTLVAHALTFILDTCPHHPTLLHALLEVCITQGLVQEAHTVLSKLFTASILPRPNSAYACPLTHPAHRNFLTTLRETCEGSDPYVVLPGHTFIINDRAFTRILVEALSQPCPEQMYAWTSKAITRLARDLRERDFSGCFALLCNGLAHVLAGSHSPRRRSTTKTGKTLDSAHSKLRDDALERLAKWVSSMLDKTRTSSDMDVHYACIEFLVDIEPLRLHVSAMPPTSPATCLADALLCLASACLASISVPPAPTNNPNFSTLEKLLRSAHIKNTTFDGLVSHIFPLPSHAIFCMPLLEVDDDTPPPTEPTNGGGGVMAIDALAVPLRNRGLLQCEAALYLAALQHVEALIASPAHVSPLEQQYSEKELYDLRLQFMDCVEDAERRCYSGVPASGTGSASSSSSADGEWVWEEVVGSWVMKSPAVAQAKKIKESELARASKRRKLEYGRDAKPSAVGSSWPHIEPYNGPPGPRERALKRCEFRVPSDGGVIPYSCPPSLSAATKRKMPSSVNTSRAVSRAASPSSKRKNKENTSDGELADYTAPAENHIPGPRRARKFATILADTHANVVSLRAEREAAATKAHAKPRASAPPRIFAMPKSPASVSVAASRAPACRRSSFATAIADSHRNVISLRAERERERAAAAEKAHATNGFSSTLTKRPFPVSDSEDEDTCMGLESSPVRTSALVEPSSDDALNLFAYPDSSPVAARRRALS